MNSVDKSKIYVVIAAYNEGEVIANTITNVHKYFDNVVVVDDCSADATSEKAYAVGAHVLRHPINLGQGAALQTGIEYAVEHRAEYIVTFDADGQHNAAEILPMVLALRQSKSQIALGSRFLGQTLNLPRHRKWILKLAILFTRITSGGNFTDVHNGFRTMTREFCTQFEFRQNRMAHASEILNYIAEHNISHIEFPVTVAYTEYSLRKGQRSSNALRVLMELFMGHISK
ncbi:Undecaprenyl-phosphate mannosyltransferase [Methylococcales bacterium]|nr:Undecaprenyl-phosphate mannosyltransferase [Methylococcales bacterium]